MKSFSIILALFLFISCDNSDDPKTTTELLTDNQWELEQFTDLDNTKISDSELTTDAKYLFTMYFEFRNDQETRAIDQVTKDVLNRGPWELDGDSLRVDVDGFNGSFYIKEISNTSLSLEAQTGNFLSDVGDKVILEFKEVL